MFILIYSGNELLASDNDVRTFETHDEAWANMVDRFVDAIRAEGNEPVLPVGGGDVFDRYDHTLFLGYLNDEEAYTEHCEEKWVIFEVQSPAPKRNTNVAETVSCECSGRIGSRVGYTPYKYEEL